MNNKGIMIVVDGSNGAGKTSLITSISEHLREKGHIVTVTREPGGTLIGEKIRGIILSNDAKMFGSTEVLLFSASRAQHFHELIVPRLNRGDIVISDRFDSAMVSFQHYGRGVDLDLINSADKISTNNFKPDATIILDLEPEIGLERVNSRGEGLDRLESEDMKFLERARQGYLKQAKENPDQFFVIDASKSQSTVFSESISIINNLIESK